jgi:RND superfamily putative drug exporter
MKALARVAGRHPWRVLAVTLALAVVAVALGGSTADRLVPFNAIDPESESVTTKQRVEQAIGFEPDAAVIAIVRSDGSVRSAAVRARVERITNRIFFDPAVAWVTNYYGSGDGSMVSENGRSTYILANLKPTSDKAKEKASRRLVEQLSSEKGVTIGGYGPGFAEFSDTAEDEIGQARRFVYPALFLVALWFFRSLVAAVLPVLVGGLAGVLAAFSADHHPRGAVRNGRPTRHRE